MADGGCCQLVGNLVLGTDACIISISTTCSTEGSIACGETIPLPGPTTGSVSITAFADNKPWVGCPAKAGLNVPYIRKYDCELDKLHFIPGGQGQSFTSGPAEQFASVKFPLYTCTSMQASSANGPAGMYIDTEQTNGYGLSYTGGPISISTEGDMEPTSLGLTGVPSEAYLQNVSFDAQPGQLPTVSYSFVFGGWSS